MDTDAANTDIDRDVRDHLFMMGQVYFGAVGTGL